jgi:hypothetical protein
LQVSALQQQQHQQLQSCHIMPNQAQQHCHCNSVMDETWHCAWRLTLAPFLLVPALAVPRCVWVHIICGLVLQLILLVCSATLCVDLSEAGQLLLPRTYLQLVGQKLLGRASTTLPVSNSGYAVHSVLEIFKDNRAGTSRQCRSIGRTCGPPCSTVYYSNGASVVQLWWRSGEQHCANNRTSLQQTSAQRDVTATAAESLVMSNLFADADLQVLLSLPEPPPDWLLQGLFTDPFAQALQLVRLAEILNARIWQMPVACSIVMCGFLNGLQDLTNDVSTRGMAEVLLRYQSYQHVQCRATWGC